MTTASEIITDAFREGNLIPIGKTPTTAQQTESLRVLNRYIFGLPGTVLGEFLSDWNTPPSRTSPVSARFPLLPLDTSLPNDVWPYPPNNVRLITKLTTDATLWLPYTPNDGAQLGLADVGSTAQLTLDANGKLIEGAPTLVLDPATVGERRWIYRADLGSWQRLDMVDLTSESPFPFEFDDLLITGLAIRLSPRFGRSARDETVATQTRMLRRMKQRYTQEMPKAGKWPASMYSRQAHGYVPRGREAG